MKSRRILKKPLSLVMMVEGFRIFTSTRRLEHHFKILIKYWILYIYRVNNSRSYICARGQSTRVSGCGFKIWMSFKKFDDWPLRRFCLYVRFARTHLNKMKRIYRGVITKFVSIKHLLYYRELPHDEHENEFYRLNVIRSYLITLDLCSTDEK